jgi:hypothetical protein
MKYVGKRERKREREKGNPLSLMSHERIERERGSS